MNSEQFRKLPLFGQEQFRELPVIRSCSEVFVKQYPDRQVILKSRLE